MRVCDVEGGERILFIFLLSFFLFFFFFFFFFAIFSLKYCKRDSER
jgi:hypothetical protein